MAMDFKGLEQFSKNLNKLNTSQKNAFIEECAKELAARLLQKVIKRTPVYAGNDRVGGTLRRGWTGEKNENAVKYAQSLPIKRMGNVYEIEIVNPVEYASYVEYGHRQEVGRFVPVLGKRLKQPWVSGKFMMTISANEIQQITPALLQKKLTKLLKELEG